MKAEVETTDKFSNEWNHYKHVEGILNVQKKKTGDCE